MLKRYLFVGTVIFACASAAICKTIIEENFEDFSKSENVKFIETRKAKVAEVSGKDALDGNGSLCIDTLGGNEEYPLSLKISAPDMKGGEVYVLSFKYKVLDAPKEKSLAFVYMQNKPSKPEERVQIIGGLRTFMFCKTPEESGIVQLKFAAIEKSDKDYYICFTSLRGIKIIIDDIKIETAPLPKCAWMFEKDAFVFLRIPPVGGEFFDPELPMFNIPKEKFFPFVDKYGQLKHRNWKNKICSDADFAKRANEESAFDKKLGQIPNRDKFGGFVDASRKYKATGKFRTEKVDGKWFFVTPEGNLFWSFGIDCGGAGATTPITLRENYFEDISDPRYIENGYWSKFFYEAKKFKTYNFTRRNIDLKYGGDIDKYYDTCNKRMSIWGLNTYGAWSNNALLKNAKIPFAFITQSVRPSTLKSKAKLDEYWQPVPDFFDPLFETQTIKHLEKFAELLNSQYCIGAFIDNELPWQNKPLILAHAILTTPETQFAKIELSKQLKKKYADIEKLNAAWKSKYESWDDFLKNRDFVPSTKKADSDLIKFEKSFYDHYFDVCKKAVKNVSGDTLYFGCRLAWTNELVEISASKYCDAVGFNLYRGNVADFDLPKGAKDKPVIIGEYHFGNQDRGVFGGGLRPCKDMQERVEKFKIYTTSAFENPRIAGAHWFQWVDQPVTGRSGDGENYSVGFVDIADTPQYEMTEAARELSQNMYTHRLSGERTVEIKKLKTTTY